jgi:hypothetical protein
MEHLEKGGKKRKKGFAAVASNETLPRKDWRDAL